jgi:hypothetical protein
MGCGCKQKQKVEPRPQVIQNDDGSVTINNPTKPNYTREEINRCMDYFISRNQTLTEKKWVVNFHNSQFPEQLSINCAECWIRLKNRIEHLDRKLKTYEDWEKSNRETEENPE